jgi:hypothetical protein
MYCRFCGSFVGIGNPHECPKEPVRKLSHLPPQRLFWWTVGGCGVIAGVLVSLAVSLAQLTDLRQIQSTVTQLGSAAEYDQLTSLIPVARRADNLGNLVIIVAFAYIIGYVVWFRMARTMVARFGQRGKQALAHWTYLVWRISILAAFALTWGLRSGRDTPTTTAEAIADLEAQTHDALILDASRALTGLLLIVALLVVMRNVWALARPVGQAEADPAAQIPPRAG